MKIGFIGLGKLGLPVALAIEAAGHEVWGYDSNPAIMDMVAYRSKLPYVEEGAQELLDHTMIQVADPGNITDWADLVFVAVQTPHQPEYEGITRLPETRADFDYSHLATAISSVLDKTEAKQIVVISTVLPGTIERLCGRTDRVLYNPFFIAMGTTIPDFRDPEFVLIGTDGAHPQPLVEFYKTIHDKPTFVTTIKTAELTKVAYNTYIGMKIVFANTMMELCHKTGADVDDLVEALSLGTDRIVSERYLRGGMGDGGGCHPRDNIALSWLARQHKLSFDLFDALMDARERQTEWLARLATAYNKPITLLGKAYKPETNLTVGSPALLLSSILTEDGYPHEHEDAHVSDHD